ncbi:DUF3080 domain-containing protein [Vibrio sp. CAU 1672]|uniref:DUF3080 domain-containing protein n=1 Tax=Vibrio sp. CAU 1672 TaxID=3032594 RepID=UPI0023DB14B0|nr:DUF3080 domain-containing protein [Vibrio sp. CAU 1672]MDF2152167.1 DUF3080 domain-containing protein [Vibrio sp. CAU 1672]
MKVLYLSLLILLVGCGRWNAEEERFVRYNQRLANVLGVEPSLVRTSPAITLPSKRKLFRETPRLTIGLLESYQLRQCGLFHLLAEKNSQHGKVWDAFHDLDYQIQLLKTMNHCLTEYNLSESEYHTLMALNQQKWDHLEWHLDNLLLTSDAMRKQVTAASWLVNEGSGSVTHVRQAFELLQKLYITPKGVSHQLPDVGVASYQEKIEKTRLIGKLYFSIVRATHWLDATTILLNNHRERIVCGPNRDESKLRYLRNVFHSIFIADVQPYLSYLDSMFNELSMPLMLFEERISARGYEYPIHADHRAFRRGTLEHVKFWQRLFDQCGIKIVS